MAEAVTRERRTALLVEVPVDASVEAFRRRHLAVSVARGLPAHVTVLFPFAPADEIDAGLRGQVAAHFSALEPFDGSLVRVGRFDEHVWLAPEPHDAFVELLRGTHARFPERPPYGDAHGDVVPHLTIGEAGADKSIAEVADLAERELGPGLPLAFRVERISLFEERVDGTWQHADSFGLG